MSGFIRIINSSHKKEIDWVHLINDSIHEQMCNVLSSTKFFMTSYLVYLLVSQASFSGLTKVGSYELGEVNIYHNYPVGVGGKFLQFGVVNDNFIYMIIRGLEGEFPRRISLEAMKLIGDIGY